MNLLLRKMLSRVYRAEEDGSGAGAAPSAGGESTPAADDWEAMNADVVPGADDSDEDDNSPPAAKAGEAPQDAASSPTNEDGTPVDPPAGDEEVDLPVPGDEPKLTPEELAAQTEKLQKDFAEWEKAELGRLEKAYGLDEETAARLQTEPELVLPKLAAQLELNATKRAIEVMQRMIPQLVQPVVHSQETEKKATKFFYDQNPDLKKHHAMVLKAGKAFREMNPKATPDEAAKKIGAMVRNALGLTTEAAAKPAVAGGKPQPHRPAGAGAGAKAPAKPAASDNMWSDLAADDDD